METRKSKFESGPGNAADPDTRFQFPVSSFHFRISNSEFRFSRWLASALAAFATFASATLANAQGCALCYNTASAMKAAGIAALRHGILILLIPPLAICLGVFYVGYRSRDHYNDPDRRDAEEQLGREPSEWAEEESGDGSEKEEVRTCG